MYRIIAFDPGVTTGWAMFEQKAKGAGAYQITKGQLGPEAHHYELYRMLLSSDAWRGDLNIMYDDAIKAVVCERFVFQQRLKAILTPVEYIGVITMYCQRTDKPLELQTPSQAKAFWDNEKLRRLGLYDTKAPHAMDAIRHLLSYISKTDDRFIRMLRPQPASGV